eukprot:612771-Rhodomonas_salina.1
MAWTSRWDGSRRSAVCVMYRPSDATKCLHSPRSDGDDQSTVQTDITCRHVNSIDRIVYCQA